MATAAPPADSCFDEQQLWIFTGIFRICNFDETSRSKKPD